LTEKQAEDIQNEQVQQAAEADSPPAWIVCCSPLLFAEVDMIDQPSTLPTRRRPPSSLVVQTARPGDLTPRRLIALGLTLLLFSSGISGQESKKDLNGNNPLKDPFDTFSVAISKDGQIVAGGGGMWDRPGEIGVWNLATRKPLQRFSEDLGVASVAFSPDGKLLASGSWTGHVRLRDWAAGKDLADFEVAGVARVAFSPNGELLATATEQKTVRLWDVAKRQLVADFQGDLLRFHCVTFSPDGKRVLAGGGDWKQGGVNQVTIWDVASKKQVQALIGHQNAIICITFSPDGKTIATGGVDKTIRLWDADSGQPFKTLQGHTHWVESLVFSIDGKTLVSSSHDHTIRFWDVDQGTEKDRITMPAGVRTVQFTPDGKTLIAGGAEKTLKIIDAANHQEVGVLWNGADPHKVEMDHLPLTVPQNVDMDESPKAKANRWLVAAEILGLVFLIALVIGSGLWLYVRQSRLAQQTPARAAIEDPHTELGSAAPPVSFACSVCGKNLRAKAELAGKKIKCLQCGQAVLVPVTKTVQNRP
jgi:DNA-directed RNA polymerase subunit RPC12/RpoP